MSSCHQGTDLGLSQALSSQLQEYAGYKILIALSGGLDSMVLCHLVMQLTTCELVFANSKRGEGDQRALALRRWAEAQGCTLHIHTSERPLVAHRDLRAYKYEAIQAHVDSKTLVLLGHHLNDQIETLFLKSMRGYNPAGWLIPRTRPLGSGLLLRPLLEFSKDTLLRYAQTHQVFYLEDPTNAYITQPRNYLRHLVLQKLLDWCPTALRGWQKSLGLLREEQTLMDNFKQRLLRQCVTAEGQLWLVPWKQLSALEQRWVLRWWLLPRPSKQALLAHWQRILLSEQAVWHYRLADQEVLWKYQGYAGVDPLPTWDVTQLEAWIQKHLKAPREALTVRALTQKDKLATFFQYHRIHPLFRSVARGIFYHSTLLAIYPYGLYNLEEK